MAATLKDYLRTRPVRVIAAAIVFAAAFVFRLATFSITNDDYLHLSLAQQVLLGDVPVRDFIDPGEFLFYYLSAAVQWLCGRHLLSEIVLDLLLLSTGYALVYLLAFRAAGSHIISVLVTGIAILLVPRLYSYPKITLYAIALTLMWGYADDRRDRRLLWLALFTAIAFLFRHDHGLYAGAATLAMLVASHAAEGWRPLLRKAVLYGGATAALLLPFFVFLQVNVGLVNYVRNTMATGRAEYQRTVGARPVFQLDWSGILPMPKLTSPRIRIRWAEGTSAAASRDLAGRFGLAAGEDQGGGTWQYDLDDRSPANVAAIVRDPRVADTDGIDRTRFTVSARAHQSNVDAWFYYLAILLPPLAVLAVVLGRVGGTPSPPLMQHELQKIITAAVLATLMHVYLLRAASDSAIADVSTPAAVLGAWLLGKGCARWRGIAWPLVRTSLAAVVLGVTLLAASQSDGGYLLAQIVRDDGQVLSIAEKLDLMRRSQAPFDHEGAQYLFHCTRPSDRVLVTGYVPAVHYQSGRGFAAGRPYFLGSFAPSRTFERFSLDRLAAERVPIVLASTGEPYADFKGAHPSIDAYLADHYRRAGEIDFDGAAFVVLVDSRIPPAGTWGARSLPCY
jgi:hypothetical protein